MFIRGMYIDPIYLVIGFILATFLLLLGVMLYLRSFLKELRGIHANIQKTVQNTEPIRKIGIIMYDVSDSVITHDSPTDKLPRIRSSIPGSAFAPPTGKLYGGSTLQSNREFDKPLDTR